jgi:hypothetical protein
MIQFFDTAAARQALARRKLPCPDCGQALKPWGHARERTVRDLGGALLTVRPDRARCVGCQVTHVMLDAGLLPRRAYAAGLIGQALVGAVRGSGHRRIAGDLDVPAGTVRGWLRGARQSAVELRMTASRVIVASGHDVPARWPPGELGFALENLGAAASITASRSGMQHVRPWALVNVLTGGKLLNMSPAG